MWRRPPGRILATKWGMNPNSSSLGVDVTFLLFGAAAVAFATPVLGALLRLRRPAIEPGGGAIEVPPPVDAAAAARSTAAPAADD